MAAYNLISPRKSCDLQLLDLGRRLKNIEIYVKSYTNFFAGEKYNSGVKEYFQSEFIFVFTVKIRPELFKVISGKINQKGLSVSRIAYFS